MTEYIRNTLVFLFCFRLCVVFSVLCRRAVDLLRITNINITNNKKNIVFGFVVGFVVQFAYRCRSTCSCLLCSGRCRLLCMSCVCTLCPYPQSYDPSTISTHLSYFPLSRQSEFLYYTRDHIMLLCVLRVMCFFRTYVMQML